MDGPSEPITRAARVYAVLDRRPWPWLLALAAVTIGLGLGIRRVDFDNSYEIWFLEDDEDLVRYRRFLERFGSDEGLVVTLTATAGDVLTDDFLRQVEALSNDMERLDGVESVWSLTRMEEFVDVGGALDVRPLVEKVPPTEDERRRARVRLRTSPLHAPLVSRDLRTTAILLVLEPTAGSFDPKARLVRRVQNRMARVPSDVRVHVSGAPAIDEALYRYSAEDTRRFLPLMGVIVLLLLGLLFRSVAGVAVPLAVVLLSCAWAYGLMGWLGWNVNLVTTVLPPVVMAVGIADSIHLLNDFRHHCVKGAEPRVAAARAFEDLLRPCFVTTVTTCAGLASLSVAALAPLREFGLVGAFGVLGAFVLSMVGVPLVLGRLPVRRLGGLARPAPAAIVGWLEPASRLSRRGSFVVLGVAAGLCVVAAFGALRVEVGASMTSYFRADDPVLREASAVDGALGGSFPLEILVTASEGRDLLEPESLRALARVEDAARRVDGTGAPVSFLDMLMDAKRALWGDEPGAADLPASRAEAAQILLLMEGEDDLGRYLSDDRRMARITLPSSISRWENTLHDLPRLDGQLRRAAGRDVGARVSGLGRLMANMERYLIESQTRTFLLAFVLVIGIIGLLFRSARVGILSTLPNLPPLLLVLGVMGWTEVRLDPGTVMIAPVLLGLVVDDTVHLIERVVRGREEGRTVDEALGRGIRLAGPALVLTSVVLVAGFLTTLTGSFKPNIYFGALSAVAIVIALAADLLLLQAVTRLAPRLWKS